MKIFRTIAIAALFLLLLGLLLFFLQKGRLPFMDHIKTRSTITKFPSVSVPQKINRKTGGPDLPAGMRSLFLIKLGFTAEGLPLSAVKSPASDSSSEGKRSRRTKGLTVEIEIGEVKISNKNVELNKDRQCTCETIVSQNVFDNTDIVKNITITCPGYAPFVKHDIPLKKVNEMTKEAMLEKILLRKE
ncbi:MAG: hypothetical protein AB2L14_29075 [Candidatus Xenobiia bacterium LiM19]